MQADGKANLLGLFFLFNHFKIIYVMSTIIFQHHGFAFSIHKKGSVLVHTARLQLKEKDYNYNHGVHIIHSPEFDETTHFVTRDKQNENIEFNIVTDAKHIDFDLIELSESSYCRYNLCFALWYKHNNQLQVNHSTYGDHNIYNFLPISCLKSFLTETEIKLTDKQYKALNKMLKVFSKKHKTELYQLNLS